VELSQYLVTFERQLILTIMKKTVRRILRC